MDRSGKEGESRACADLAAIARAGEDGDGPPRHPYRPVPRDFVERWPQFGWGKHRTDRVGNVTWGAEIEWRAHARTIARWVDLCGRDEMVMARKRYIEAQRLVQSRSRRSRYVMGRTLSPVGSQAHDDMML